MSIVGAWLLEPVRLPAPQDEDAGDLVLEPVEGEVLEAVPGGRLPVPGSFLHEDVADDHSLDDFGLEVVVVHAGTYCPTGRDVFIELIEPVLEVVDVLGAGAVDETSFHAGVDQTQHHRDEGTCVLREAADADEVGRLRELPAVVANGFHSRTAVGELRQLVLAIVRVHRDGVGVAADRLGNDHVAAGVVADGRERGLGDRFRSDDVAPAGADAIAEVAVAGAVGLGVGLAWNQHHDEDPSEEQDQS